MKTLLGLAAIGFCVALAVIVGYRMSAEAMAVVIGVACGVLASIPMSALILIVMQRQGARRSEELTWQQQRNVPPVVVIQGGTPMSMSRPEMPLFQPPMVSPAPREFKVIGEEWSMADRGR